MPGNIKIFYFFLLFISLNASARKFYITTSGNDNNTITQAQNPTTAWKTLIRIETFGNSGLALPGDTFAFKCGDTFDNGRDWFGSFRWWNVNGYTCPSGTANNPIVFTSYGSGAKPNFLFPFPSSTIGNNRHVLSFEGVSNIVIDGIQSNDVRFQYNDKVSTAYTGNGILLGEEGAGHVNNILVKNCYFNNLGYGIQAAGDFISIVNDTFINMKNVGDTSGLFDVGAIPIVVSSGKHYLIKNNYLKGGWAFTGYQASGQGLNGGSIEILNNFDSSLIIYNTIIDCAGGFETGNFTGNNSIGPNDDTIAYNKFINTGNLAYSNPHVNAQRLRFWNNIYVENEYSRFSGPRFGTDVYGDGLSFAGFVNWPLFPKNPSLFNYGSSRILQYNSDSWTIGDTLFDARNNIFWMTNKNQAIYDSTRIKTKHANNIYHLVGQSVLGGKLNLNPENIEIVSPDKIFTDTSNSHPEFWDFHLNSTSPAINFGRFVGLTYDFSYNTIFGNPDNGIYEFSNPLFNSLSINVVTSLINCNGELSTVTVTATGGTAPYTGIGTFIVTPGSYTYTVTDAVGSVKTSTVIITQPSAITATVTTGRIIVYGGTTTLTINAIGGTGAYNYKLNSGVYQASNIFNNVVAGNDTVFIKDANNCIITKIISVTQPSSPLSITVTPSTILCNGGVSIVTVTASGGTAPYTGTGTFTVVAGTYSYSIADSNAVTASSSVIISQPTLVTGSVTSGVIAVYGAKTTITLSNVSGGLPPYLYALNDGIYQTAAIFNNVPAGIHSVSIKDASGCTIVKSITITQPVTTLACSAVATNILCNGGLSTVTVTATGGTAPYTGIGTFTVAPGSYTYRVTDAVGSVKISIVTVTQPITITATVATGRIIVYGSATTLTVSAIGGTGAFTYKLNRGVYQASNIFSNVLAGNDTVFVKDANNCVITKMISITQPSSPLSITVTPSAILCNGGLSIVTVTASGGTAPYSGTGTFTVVAGTYSYSIADSNAVTATSSVVINQPALVTGTVTPGVIAVYGAKTTITLSNVSGGLSPYSYALNNGVYQTAAIFNNVPAGIHSVSIKDANGCTIVNSITITQPVTTLACSAVATNILCNGGLSIVTVTATGGTAPYTGIGTFTVTPGSYTYTVTDAVGSIKTSTVTINQPSAITATVTTGRIIVYGGTTTLTVSAIGGTGACTYKLNNGVYQTSNIFNNVAVGNDTVFVKDANNCIITKMISVTQPSSPLSITVTPSTILCNGGVSLVTVTANGGTAPYTGIGTFTVVAGTYSYSIADSNAVTASASVVISQPALVTGTVTPGVIAVYGAKTTITLSNVSGGLSPYLYALNNGVYQTTAIFNNVPAGIHSVNIKDTSGCTIVKTITITQPVTTLACSAVASIINCNGGYSTVTVTATGGTIPYTGIGRFTKRSGSYTFTITDAVGSVKTSTVTITQPTAITATVATGRIIVYGGTTTLIVSAIGGTGAFTYKLNSGVYQTSNIFSNIAAGNDTVFVKDAKNCVITKLINITQPSSPLSITVTPSAILCNGGSSIVTVTATGGTAPYTGTGTFTVVAGTYSYSIADSNAVTASASVVISQPALVTGTVTPGVIAVYGAKTTITLSNVSGGLSPYLYALNNGVYQNAAIFNNVPAGMHSVIIKDTNGCTIVNSITITQPVTTLACSAVATNILCNGSFSTVTVTATGGTAPYTGIGTFTVASGSYTNSVTDAVGSVKTSTVTINQPSAITATVSTGRIIVYGGTTTLTVTAIGGTGAYTYKLNRGAYQTSNIFSNVAAGNDTAFVKDANNCVITKMITVTQPSRLILLATPGRILCNNGSTTIAVAGIGGTPPYTGVGTYVVNAGTYTYSISDSNNITETTTLIIPQPTAIVATVIPLTSSIPIYGGTTSIVISNVTGGTTPYSYSLNNGLFQLSTTFTNVNAGNHVVNIKDSNGCIITKNIYIKQPLKILITSSVNISCQGQTNGSITVTADGGKPPYKFRYGPLNGTTSAYTSFVMSVNYPNLAPGIYVLKVKDSLNVISSMNDTILPSSILCTRNVNHHNPTDSKMIIVPANEIYSVYPNPTNNQFKINLPKKNCNKFQLSVYNSNGEKVIEKFDYSTDITFGKELLPGIYYIRICVNDIITTKKIVKTN